MKKVEIVVVVILAISLGLYVLPNLTLDKGKRKNAIVKTNCAIFTSNIVAQFAQNKNIKASVAAQNAIEELNKTNENPVRKGVAAFHLNETCAGCVKVEADDRNKIITLEGFGADGKLIQKTTINPPSYVVYEK